jgi:hypothetical protein
MPAIYAHDTFGRIVYKKSEGDMHDLIHRYSNFFRIGLQGPDYLFFYRPLKSNAVNELGHRLHEESALDFFTNAREIISDHGKDSPEMAYILGVLCHFMLDSECHGYIDRMAEKTGIGHNDIETELDRSLLLRRGINPADFYMGNLVPVTERIAWVISEFYEGVSPSQVQECLKTMRGLKNLLHIGSAQKEKIIFGLMDRLGVADSFGGVVMGLEADENCAPIVKELITRYKNALEPALIMLEYYYEEWDSQDPLPERLNRNYL